MITVNEVHLQECYYNKSICTYNFYLKKLEQVCSKIYVFEE